MILKPTYDIKGVTNKNPFWSRLELAQIDFRAALSDSFDTPRAIQILLDLVSTSNVYLARGRNQVNVGVVSAVSEWVTRMLRMFGLGEGPATDGRGEKLVGWGTATKAGENDSIDVSLYSFLFLSHIFPYT